MNKLLALIAIFAFAGNWARAAPPEQSEERFQQAMQDQSAYNLVIHEFLDGETPKGAIKVPASEMSAHLQASAWRLEGKLYILTANPLTGTVPGPSVIAADSQSGRSISVFDTPVYFIESKSILKP